MAGDPPWLLAHGDLVAVVSHVPEGDFSDGSCAATWRIWTGSPGTARAHQQVIDALTAVTTPLPPGWPPSSGTTAAYA